MRIHAHGQPGAEAQLARREPGYGLAVPDDPAPAVEVDRQLELELGVAAAVVIDLAQSDQRRAAQPPAGAEALVGRGPVHLLLGGNGHAAAMFGDGPWPVNPGLSPQIAAAARQG